MLLLQQEPERWLRINASALRSGAGSVGGEGNIHEDLWVTVLLTHRSSAEPSAYSEPVNKSGVCCFPAGGKRRHKFCLEKFLDCPERYVLRQRCAVQCYASLAGAVRLTEQVQFRDSLLVSSVEATQPNNCGTLLLTLFKKKIDFKERGERGRFVPLFACSLVHSRMCPNWGLKHNLGLSGRRSDPRDTQPKPVVGS